MTLSPRHARGSGRVIVVGAGIVGSATAWALARAGVRVTLIEAGPIPNPRAASTDHHRLIRYPYAGQPGYTARIDEAFAAWRRLWADLGGTEPRYFAERGILTMTRESGDRGDRARAALDVAGVPYETIADPADVAARFPHIDPRNSASAILSGGGALMANHILTDLADWLRRAGVAVMELSPVTAIDRRAGTVHLADGREIGGDLVVLTAGVASPDLAPELRATLSPWRTVIVYAQPPAHLADAFATAPCWSELGTEDELWGMPTIDGLPAKLGAGALGRQDASDEDRAMSAEEVAAMISAYRGVFRDIEMFDVRFHQANYWTLAPEERFLLARDERLLIASACSGHGFKFGALSGEDIASAARGAEKTEDVAARMAARTPADA